MSGLGLARATRDLPDVALAFNISDGRTFGHGRASPFTPELRKSRGLACSPRTRFHIRGDDVRVHLVRIEAPCFFDPSQMLMNFSPRDRIAVRVEKHIEHCLPLPRVVEQVVVFHAQAGVLLSLRFQGLPQASLRGRHLGQAVNHAMKQFGLDRSLSFLGRNLQFLEHPIGQLEAATAVDRSLQARYHLSIETTTRNRRLFFEIGSELRGHTKWVRRLLFRFHPPIIDSF